LLCSIETHWDGREDLVPSDSKRRRRTDVARPRSTSPGSRSVGGLARACAHGADSRCNPHSAPVALLQRHNVIEEGPGGIYRLFEQWPGIDADSILAKLQAAPTVAMNPHVDNATAIESMRAAVHRAGYSFEL
jgi:hypothetical protein